MWVALGIFILSPYKDIYNTNILKYILFCHALNTRHTQKDTKQRDTNKQKIFTFFFIFFIVDSSFLE